MLRMIFFLSVFISLCCTGFIISAQSEGIEEGYEVILVSDDGYVVNSEVDIRLMVISLGDPLPTEPDTLTISYDSEFLAINKEIGNNGVEVTSRCKQLEVDSSIPGKLIMKMLYFDHATTFTLHFISLKTGTSPITATMIPDYFLIHNTEVKIVDYGDVNGDSSIDILDALLVAQKYVGMYFDFFIGSAAEVNCDQNIDIVDALLIAQYYVELIDEFPLCNGNTTPIPTPDPTPVVTSIPEIIMGDVNGSGFVDVIDCILVAQYINGLKPEPFYIEAADVNFDGVIDMEDSQLICNFEYEL